MPATQPVAPEPTGEFVSTRWTVVLAAGDSGASSGRAHNALSELCRNYWQPLYLFLRREGYGPEDAQDLTQGFLATLIRDRSSLRADPERGRFRTFLLGALKNFVCDARDRERAQKRGGGRTLEPFDDRAIAEVEAQLPPNEKSSAAFLYDREWAAALLRQTQARLAQEYALSGKSSLFENLKAHLWGAGDEAIPYEQISRQLQRGLATLRSDLARLRTRYRAILREEVRETVAAPADVDDELRYLCRVIGHA